MTSAKALADGSPGNPALALAGLQPPAIDLNKVAKPANASRLADQANALHSRLAAAAPGEAPTLHVKGLLDAANAELPGVVKAFDDDQVTIDFNHPLAGKTLTFEVEILEVKAL